MSRPSLEAAFGAAVRAVRLKRALSQEALADRSQLHRTFVSQLERGLKSPSLASMARIAAALTVPLNELVAEALRIRNAQTGADRRRRDGRTDGNRGTH